MAVAQSAAASGLPVYVTWDGGNATHYQLEYSRNGSATWTPVTLTEPAATKATVPLQVDNFANQPTYQFRVRAGQKQADGTTTWSEWQSGARFTLTAADDPTTAALNYGGNWTTQSLAGAWGPTVRFASTAKDKVRLNRLTYLVEGNATWIGTMGPNMGRATVSVDGGAPVTVDLYSPTVKRANLVWVGNGLSATRHEIAVQVLGTKNAASTGTRVDIDGFVSLH
jgi:hypothetical protein